MNTLIVTGGKIDENFLKKHLNENKYDIIIAVDKGLEILDELNIEPNYIIGDFDSIDKKILEKYKKSNSNIKELMPEKDFTDTESAIEFAIKLNSFAITLIGAIGTRLDHTIANIHILKKALDKNIEAKVIDLNNEIFLANKNIKIKKDINYKYISILPLTTEVKELTLRGLKYSLNNYNLKVGTSLTVSNEQIEDEAEIEFKEGIIIVIKSRD